MQLACYALLYSYSIHYHTSLVAQHRCTVIMTVSYVHYRALQKKHMLLTVSYSLYYTCTALLLSALVPSSETKAFRFVASSRSFVRIQVERASHRSRRKSSVRAFDYHLPFNKMPSHPYPTQLGPILHIPSTDLPTEAIHQLAHLKLPLIEDLTTCDVQKNSIPTLRQYIHVYSKSLTIHQSGFVSNIQQMLV